jgi:hypothetical protein
MGRLQALILPAVLAIGCTTARTAKHEVQSAVQNAGESLGLMPATPATQLDTAWSKRLMQLPDPSRNGAMTNGLTGQVFLFTPDFNLPGEFGELTVFVTDVTPRGPGQLAAKPEAWHFTADVLKRMRVFDERFGWSLAVFLPWPQEWDGVNQVNIQCRYDNPNAGDTIWAPQTTLTIDHSQANGATAGGTVRNSSTKVLPVPDPKATLEGLKKPGMEINGAWAGPPPVAPAMVKPTNPAPANVPIVPAVPTPPGSEFKATISRK